MGCDLQTNSKQPDWIHWETKQGLWIESATTPSWVRTKLHVQAPTEKKSPTERGALNLDDDEVSSDDQHLQESVTIKSMYVLLNTTLIYVRKLLHFS